MFAPEERRPGLFPLLPNDTDADMAGNWSCACGWCCDPGQGSNLGAWGTTPTAQSYAFVEHAAIGAATAEAAATLVAGSKWSSLDPDSGKTIVTYSFIDPQTSTFAYGTLSEFTLGASAFTPADRQVTREVLATIAAVCNVEFVEVADDASQAGVIRYGYSQQPNAMNYSGYAFFPSASPSGGDVWIGTAQAQPQSDLYRPNLILHETLHALGLKHPFSGAHVLSASHDVIPNTVMSYSTVAGGTAGSMASYPAGPMAYDIAALQQLYGAAATAAGDDRYDLASADFQDSFHALWDAGGSDTLDAGGVAQGVQLDLGAGAGSDIGLRIAAVADVSGTPVSAVYSQTLTLAQGVAIENAAGSAYADLLIGNAGANRLEGRGGDDQLQGGVGLDTAVYAGSRSQFQVSQAAGAATVRDLTGAEGTDALAGIERLWFADGGLALDLEGNAGAAAKILGVVFGAAAVANASYVGQALAVLDGGMSFESAMQLAIELRLGSDATPAEVVDLFYTQLLGSHPTPAQAQPFVQLLQSAALTPAQLGLMAAEHALNLAHIGLTGLAADGLAYG
jgi:serralysin